MSPADKYRAMITGLNAAGLSKSDIARQTGVSKATVSRMGQGECRDPSYSTVTRIKTLAEKHGVTMPPVLTRR